MIAPLAAGFLASAAHARDNSVYVEADGGVVFVNNITTTVGTGAGGTGTPSLGVFDTKAGYDFGGILGYDFGMFRLEAEASYRHASASNYDIGGTTYTRPALIGNASALSFMGNALIDLGSDSGVQFFAGGGVGYGRVRNRVSLADRTDNLDDRDWGFAWQLLGGVRVPLGDNWDLGLKYRYYDQNHVDLVNSAGTPLRNHFRSHSGLVTLAYNFGGAPREKVAEAAPPPAPAAEAPPPPPPPAPPPPPPPCNHGPYIVFFDWNSADVTADAGQILDNAITAYGNCASVPIMLAGYADRSGSATYNMALSARRNVSVRGYLTAHGVPDGSITSQAFGETNPRVPTADGVRELQNRRVEITYGPGSGS
jgi:outer membrane protein OmpA-like peptidoglycan-associated protein